MFVWSFGMMCVFWVRETVR